MTEYVDGAPVYRDGTVGLRHLEVLDRRTPPATTPAVTVAAIRADYAAGLGYRRLSAKYGVGRSTARHIALGLSHRGGPPIRAWEKSAPFEQRFWASVDRWNPDECWVWTGGAQNQGYGTISRQGRKVLAHRVAFEMHLGAIPEGLELDHLCRNTLCVNPKHLEPVTHAENMRRAGGRERCQRGHLRSEAGLYVSRGRRTCRRCARDSENARNARWRAAS